MSGNEILKTFSGENHVVKVEKSGEKKEAYVAIKVNELAKELVLIIAIPDGKGKHVVESHFLGYTDVIHALDTYVRPHYIIREVIYDDWDTSRFIVSDLKDRGYKLMPYNESTRFMSPCIKELLDLIKDNKILHTGHPELQRQINLADATEDAKGNLNYVKKDFGYIGAVVALTVAVSRSIRHKEGRHKPQPPKAAFPTYNPKPKNDTDDIGALRVEIDTSLVIDAIRESFRKELGLEQRAKGLKESEWNKAVKESNYVIECGCIVKEEDVKKLAKRINQINKVETERKLRAKGLM